MRRALIGALFVHPARDIGDLLFQALIDALQFIDFLLLRSHRAIECLQGVLLKGELRLQLDQLRAQF